MKITVHWDRIFALLVALLVCWIAVEYFKYLHRYEHSTSDEIGQCDMHEAQNIVDNLVRHRSSYFEFERSI